MNLINNILKIRFRDQKTLVITIVLSFFVLFIVLYFIFLPALKGAYALSQQIKEKKVNLSDVQTSTGEYSLLEDRVKKTKEELEVLKNRIFWEKDIGRFLNVISQLASGLQIEFISLKPEKPESSSWPAEKDKKGSLGYSLTQVPITILIRGSYSNLVKFLKRIDKYDKFINIYGLNIASDPHNIYRHNIKIGLSIFNKEEG